jgi:hypothetical protein
MGKSYSQKDYDYDYEDGNKKASFKKKNIINNNHRRSNNRDLLRKWQNADPYDDDFYD